MPFKARVMKLSKSILYVGIIAYSAALLIFQDWPTMTDTVGALSAAFLFKMVVDIGFALVATVRLIGPSLFDLDEGEDDGAVSVTASDLAVSDQALYGLFLINVIGNGAWHGYYTVMTTGASSFGSSLFVIVDVVALFLTWVLFRAAVKSARRQARKARNVSNINRAA